jgi:hypothetical protein
VVTRDQHGTWKIGWQIEVYTAEHCCFAVEIAIAKFKKYKLPGSDQILGKLIKPGSEKLLPVIHKLINSVWSKEELPGQWKDSIIVTIHKKG